MDFSIPSKLTLCVCYPLVQIHVVENERQFIQLYIVSSNHWIKIINKLFSITYEKLIYHLMSLQPIHLTHLMVPWVFPLPPKH